MTDVFIVMGCHIDLTDPEPNVWINNIFSKESDAKKTVSKLQKESPDCWFGWFKREIDGKEGIVLDKDIVDMSMFY